MRAMETLPIFVLEPPYSMVRWLRDVPPALGSILLVDGTGRRPTPNDVREVMSLAPWCPVVVLGRDRTELRAIRRSPRIGVLAGEPLGNQFGRAIIDAVLGRPLPSPSDLTDWVVRRTNAPLLSRTLSDMFSGAASRSAATPGLATTWARHLAQLGTWTASEWQSAAHLAELAANREGLARVMIAEDVHSTETRRTMADFDRIASRQFSALVGWEWVLEAALRESGYFDRAAEELRLTIRRRAPERHKAVPVLAYDPPRIETGSRLSA
jgi:hypothetical protein